MASRATHINSSPESLVHYLRPALEDLRHLEMPFETYLLEMLVQALCEQAGSGAESLRRLHAVS